MRSHLTVEERFWAKVDKTNSSHGCWLWTASKTRRGYGNFKADGVMVRANRYAWAAAHGPIPEGMIVCHNCPGGDNPTCVNPAHLWLGTHADNAADRVRKGRQGKCAPINPARGIRNGAYTKPESLRRGDLNGRTRIADSVVQEMRRVYAVGGINFAELGRMFGIDTSNSRKIALGLTRL